MSDNIRDMVEDPHAHPDIETATSLAEAANSGESLTGYAAINDADNDVARLAFQYFEERQQQGIDGCAEDDWFRAEQEVRRRKNS